MNVKKPLMMAGVASTLAVGGVTGLGVVSAATDSSSGGGTSLVDAIANKFGLKKSDVQAVVDANRQQHEQQRQERISAELDKLVSDGKLTSSQKDLIVAKQAEVKTFMDSLKDKSGPDRRSAVKNERDSLKTWARQNNIPLQDLRFVMPFGHGHGGPGGHGHDMDQASGPNSN